MSRCAGLLAQPPDFFVTYPDEKKKARLEAQNPEERPDPVEFTVMRDAATEKAARKMAEGVAQRRQVVARVYERTDLTRDVGGWVWDNELVCAFNEQGQEMDPEDPAFQSIVGHDDPDDDDQGDDDQDDDDQGGDLNDDDDDLDDEDGEDDDQDDAQDPSAADLQQDKFRSYVLLLAAAPSAAEAHKALTRAEADEDVAAVAELLRQVHDTLYAES